MDYDMPILNGVEVIIIVFNILGHEKNKADGWGG